MKAKKTGLHWTPLATPRFGTFGAPLPGFYSDKAVEFDAADMGLVKTAIETTRLYNNLVTGQLLVLLGESEG